jgi:hypothetical protein
LAKLMLTKKVVDARDKDFKKRIVKPYKINCRK